MHRAKQRPLISRTWSIASNARQRRQSKVIVRFASDVKVLIRSQFKIYFDVAIFQKNKKIDWVGLTLFCTLLNSEERDLSLHISRFIFRIILELSFLCYFVCNLHETAVICLKLTNANDYMESFSYVNFTVRIPLIWNIWLRNYISAAKWREIK